jgi:hypothetical protein
MAGAVQKKLAHTVKIAGWVSTMPWICLQAPIEQILQERNATLQEKQLNEWKIKKNSELEMVSFAVGHPIRFKNIHD